MRRHPGATRWTAYYTSAGPNYASLKLGAQHELDTTRSAGSDRARIDNAGNASKAAADRLRDALREPRRDHADGRRRRGEAGGSDRGRCRPRAHLSAACRHRARLKVERQVWPSAVDEQSADGAESAAGAA